MRKFKSQLREIIQDLEASRKTYEGYLRSCPDGVLKRSVDRGRIQYFQITKTNGKRKRHGINRNQRLIKSLAEKAYFQETLDLIKENLCQLKQAFESTEDHDADCILEKLQRDFPELSKACFFDQKNWIAENPADRTLQQRLESHITWADSPYEKSTYRKWDLKVTTSRGLLVRTKSEALIAEKLYEYGIPFRYEQILWIDDSLIVPDFTFETASGDELFWEHAGMLENMYYSFRHHLKMMQYEAASIFPWQKLIVTYDIDNELNLQVVDDMIRHILLPRL